MPIFFWIDLSALFISFAIATSLLAVVFGTGPGRSVNRTFSVFAFMVMGWLGTLSTSN